MGILNIKSLNKEGIKKEIQKALKPIIVKHSKSPCRTCGSKR